jgi:integrase
MRQSIRAARKCFQEAPLPSRSQRQILTVGLRRINSNLEDRSPKAVQFLVFGAKLFVSRMGGRLYSGNRRDKIWSEEDIATLLSTAPKEIQLALMLAIWTGQRQGDLLRLPWSAYDGTISGSSSQRPAGAS